MIILNKRDTLFWKFAEHLLYVFIVTFPFVMYKTFLYTGTSSRSLNLILLTSSLGIVFAISLFKRSSIFSIPKSPVLLAIGIYFLFLVISGIFGLSFSNSFWSVATRMSGIWYFLNLGILVYILWGLFSDRLRQNKIILTIVISSALYSFLAFLSPEGINILFKSYSSEAFTFGNSSFAAMYIFGAFILSLYYLLQSEKKKWWMYTLPVILLINPNIISSRVWSGDFSSGFIGQARTSTYVIILSVVFIFVIWLISKIKNTKTRLHTVYSVFSISIVSMIVLAFSLLSHDGALRKVYLNQATGARPLVWEISEKVIAQKPYLGWGSDNFERVFELNYDNRLLQDEYGNEAWFDRAHNVFIDQLVDNGFIGLILYILIYIVIILTLIHTTLKSKNKNDRMLASLLIVYFSLHLVELQTAFDTTISYPMLAVMTALAIILYDRTRSENIKKDNEWELNNWLKYIVASVLITFCLWTFIRGWIPVIRAEITNGYIRTIGSSEKRSEAYPILLSSPVDKHSFLWRMSTDFQKGISENPKILEDVNKVDLLKKEILIFENGYREYIKENPSHYRARLNLADMLIYQRLLGVDKLKEAQIVLDEAIKMVPQAPQSYWMKAVGYIYMKKFDLAKEYARKGLEVNPKIKQSQNVVKYVDTSIKNFPEIDLYFFRQI